jgi:hypothetical protein
MRIDIVTCRSVARKRVDKHVSMDTSDQQTFPWIPTRCIRDRSDQNEVNRKSEVSRSPVRMEQVLGRHLL